MRCLPRAVALTVAALTCPCHAPLIAALLAGTGAGAVFAAQLGLVTAALACVFAGTLVLGLSGTSHLLARRIRRGAPNNSDDPTEEECAHG
jgi:hypothetical protein